MSAYVHCAFRNYNRNEPLTAFLWFPNELGWSYAERLKHARDAGASVLLGTTDESAKRIVIEAVEWKKVVDAAKLMPQ